MSRVHEDIEKGCDAIINVNIMKEYNKSDVGKKLVIEVDIINHIVSDSIKNTFSNGNQHKILKTDIQSPEMYKMLEEAANVTKIAYEERLARVSRR